MMLLFRLVQEYLISEDRGGHKLGRSWATRFMKRHKQELTLRRGASLTALCVKAMTRHKLNHFYQILGDLFKV